MPANKIYLIVSIDTECDKGQKWKIQRPMAFRNITEGVPDKLQPLFEKYTVRATYLLSPEILHDDTCVAVFRQCKNIELGTHLHHEFIEPQADWEADRTKGIQRDLTPEIEMEKLRSLTELFEGRFGMQPTSFRAGRFGIGPHTLSFLDELGYLVDSSVTPYKTHYYESGSMNNFWGERHWPYRVRGKRILQVPVTIINKDFARLPQWLLQLLEDRRTFARRIFNRLGYRTKSEWLRPFRSDGRKLIEIAGEVIRTTPGSIIPVLNIMFHSNEIWPGASPYCQTNEEVDNYIQSLDILFQYLYNNYNVCSIGLGEYASYFS